MEKLLILLQRRINAGQPTAKAVPVGDQNAVGSELLWRTVRGDGGLALPVFVRTPQPKVRCPRSARAMRRASASSGRCGFHYRCERPWHSRHGLFDSARPHRASPLRGWRVRACPNRLQALTHPSVHALRAACGSLSHSVRLAGFPANHTRIPGVFQSCDGVKANKRRDSSR